MFESKKKRSKTICGHENVGPKKCWVQKNVSWCQKNWILKMCGSQTKFASKEMLVQKCLVQKLLVWKYLCSKSFLSPKNNVLKQYQVQTNFWTKIICVVQNCWVQNLFILFWGQCNFVWGLTKLKAQIKCGVKNYVSPTRSV